MSELFLGEQVDPSSHARSGIKVLLDPASLTTHGVIVGQTGSGKTGLGIGLIEEALRNGIPTLLIDPKGDLSNLLLTFPELRPEDFAPWVEGADPAETAQKWREGLASWGLDGLQIQRFKDQATVTVYTPGSSAGVPLNLMGSLRAPKGAQDNAEARTDEIGSVVDGILGLLGIESDPLSGREHILLSNILDRAWSAGADLDMATLIAQVQSPPLKKLGVLELDSFYPPSDRMTLALKLNGLLASPSFASWAEGLPVDIDAMLRDSTGKPRAAIVSIAHLNDEERQFAVAVILGRLVTWMRQQPGTSQLRALVYFDEVFGYVPPTAMPPSKKPILTLLKQARAFGVGLVLATQNPVDIDYKALSNAATWVVGRLQTERDKDRLLDGMRSAAGGVNIDEIGATISGLAKREFVLHRVGTPQPVVFTSRWTMSYLRGPLTREQISALMANVAEKAQAAAATSSSQQSANATGTGTGNASAPELADNEVPIAPPTAKGTPVFYLNPYATWAPEIGAQPGANRYEAAIAVRVGLLFDEEKAGLREQRDWQAIIHPLDRSINPAEAKLVTIRESDLVSDIPSDATYVLPEGEIKDSAWIKNAQKSVVDYLLATQTIQIYRNEKLKVWSQATETEADFVARCDSLAAQQSATERTALEKKFDDKIDKVSDSVREAERRAAIVREEASSRKKNEIISGAGALLGALFGSRKKASSIARSLGGAANRRGRSSTSAAKVEGAEDKIENLQQDLEQLETSRTDELFALETKWRDIARSTTSVDVTVERADINVQEFAILWVPVAG